MEYIRIDKSWEESMESGDIEQAIKRIEYQIAMNLMNVNNMFAEKKMSSPTDVYAFMSYGKSTDENVKEKMKPFIEIDMDFIEMGHGLDADSKCPKEYVFEGYKNIEKALQDAMNKL